MSNGFKWQSGNRHGWRFGWSSKGGYPVTTGCLSFYAADPAYGEGVAQGLDIDIKEVTETTAAIAD